MKQKLILLCAMTLCLATTALAHPTMTLELYRKFWPTAETAVVKRITLYEAKKAAIKTGLGGQYPKGLNDVDTFIVSSKTTTLGVLCNLEVEGAEAEPGLDGGAAKVLRLLAALARAEAVQVEDGAARRRRRLVVGVGEMRIRLPGNPDRQSLEQ